MGTVWRARDTALHRDVALKEVRPAVPRPAGEDPESTHLQHERVQHERVLREARALARLRHPNVVTIHHIVDQDPYPWLVMEFVPGRSLQDRLETGPLDPREAARVGRDVLAALRAAHAAGVHHRDVKPANILLREDTEGAEGSEGAWTAVLTDFGIAGFPGVSRLTQTGEMIGSPEYMAPERVRGADDAPASDLWSLGMTLYVAVEGTSPMRRGTGLATLAAVLGEPVPPPLHAGPLAPVLSQLLVPDPQARPDASRLDALLAAVADGTAAPTVPSWPAPDPAPGPKSPAADEPSGRGTDGPTPTVRWKAPTSRPASRRVAPAVAAAVVSAALVAAASYLALTSSSDADAQAAGGTGATATVTTTAVAVTASGSATKSSDPRRGSGSSAGTSGATAAAASAVEAAAGRTAGTSGSEESAGPSDDSGSAASGPGSTATATVTATSADGGTVVSSGALRGSQSGRCLTANLYAAAIKTCTGLAGQVWAYGANGSLKGAHGYLTATAGSNALRTTADYTGDGLQRWHPTSGGEIVNEETGYCVNVDGQATDDGSKVSLHTCSGRTNQVWVWQ
ncbi:protein kinase [Streptomyces sp. NPDC002588]|uniref:protein kinase domain-containing protein n=1 Tax=Streptomyces sp. NPDC002588 TaxID=3154419 RepID=UPI00332FDEA5